MSEPEHRWRGVNPNQVSGRTEQLQEGGVAAMKADDTSHRHQSTPQRTRTTGVGTLKEGLEWRAQRRVCAPALVRGGDD